MALQKDSVVGSAVKRVFSDESNKKTINEFSKTRDNIDNCITKLKLTEESNKTVINDAKQQLTMLYNQAIAQVCCRLYTILTVVLEKVPYKSLSSVLVLLCNLICLTGFGTGLSSRAGLFVQVVWECLTTKINQFNCIT